MATVYMDLINALIPWILIIVPAFLTYTYVPTRAGLVAGACIGIGVGVSGGIMDNWYVVLAVVMLASLVFMEYKDNIGIEELGG